jgi:diguanylate cyclase (GGDEF)-like protein/PAS domain S-box-containing protein
MKPPTKPVRLLLVDDDEDDYVITRDTLAGQERLPFRLDWTQAYGDARSIIAEARHDLYLVDYRLGERSGLDLIRDVRAELAGPVILLTGHGDYDVDLEAAELGVTDYLVKATLDPPNFERSIRYALRHHRAMGELRRSEERYALAVSAANDGIWDWDLVEGTVYFSSRWKALLGLAEEFRADRPEAWFDLVHPDDLKRLTAEIERHLAGQSPHFQNEHRMRHASGEWRWVLSRGAATRDRSGRPTRMAGSLSDITARRDAEGELTHRALHDALTGLPNRALFMDRLGQRLARSRRDPDRACAVLFIDVDRFKLVNDGMSHAVGDRLLEELAKRLSAALRAGDTVARLGGDEFTVLLDEVDSPAAVLGTARRLQDDIAAGFSIAGHQLEVTASIGIAHGSADVTGAELLRNADIAMYAAKQRGRGCVDVFDTSMRKRILNRVSLEAELRHAVQEERLRTFFQPIVNLDTRAIVGFEALARWPADRTPVRPVDFIPVAEETGLIHPLGRLVLRTACRSLAAWRERGLVGPDVTVSVNVSGRQLFDDGLVDDLHDALADAKLPPASLVLELTESTLIDSPELMRARLQQILEIGAGIQLDDFGTGYSSLTLLHHFPGDTLKIDRSFVASIDERDESTVIIRSIASLARHLGLHVIAEGIDDARQVDTLRRLGCEFGQGFYFARPLPRSEVEALLSQTATAPLSTAALKRP